MIRAGIIIWQVLVEGAAGPDVQQLGSAADSQHRKAVRDCGCQDRELGGVPLRMTRDGQRMGSVPVERGIQIGSSTEQDSVEARDH
jgi:hypothetical protein